MKKEDKIYLVSADIAERAQCIESSYRTEDGRYIISEKALRDFRFQMTAEEYVTGLDAEIITKAQAQRLMKANNYAIGPELPPDPEPEVNEETPTEEGTAEEDPGTQAEDDESQGVEESPTAEETGNEQNEE